MTIAAIAFLTLYLLVGLRSIFWYRTVQMIIEDLKPRVPRWYLAVVLVVSVPFDVVLWPLNAIDRHRKAGRT